MAEAASGAGTKIAIAILAAGSSQRFGDQDKLTAIFRSKPLGLHATGAVPAQLFARRWVIASSDQHPCAAAWQQQGFTLSVNGNADRGMGTSVALAAHLAVEAGCEALAIALADMPLVPPAHYAALALRARERGEGAIVVSSAGGVNMPPAIFGSAHLDTLCRLEADIGARPLLAGGEVVECPAQWLVDVDTPDMLRALD